MSCKYCYHCSVKNEDTITGIKIPTRKGKTRNPKSQDLEKKPKPFRVCDHEYISVIGGKKCIHCDLNLPTITR